MRNLDTTASSLAIAKLYALVGSRGGGSLNKSQMRHEPNLREQSLQLAGILVPCAVVAGAVLGGVALGFREATPDVRNAVNLALWISFWVLLCFGAVGIWFAMTRGRAQRQASLSDFQVRNTQLAAQIEARAGAAALLQKAKDRAEAANVSKTRYVVSVSHELRTPLNAILGYAQLLERDPALLQPQLDSVKVMRRSAEHLASLVDGLLDISRIEAGSFRLNRGPINLGEFLDQMADMVRLQASVKGLDFHFQTSSPLPSFVLADGKRLRQILLNLLSNAIKYTQVGSATLRVRYRGEVAIFEVIDTGMGIPKEDLERIFEPFERGRTSTVQYVPGTGLGLTIAHLLTELMGGELSVESEVGKGSVFRVRALLPRSDEPNEPVLEGLRVCGYQGARRKILLVDDDPAHMQLMTDILAPLGFDLLTATDGATALEIAQKGKPDLALLDISMPGMHGWTVAQRLRDMLDDSVSIMMVSANVHEVRTTNRTETSHDAFLVKPFDIRRLYEKLEDLLNLEWTYELPLPIRRGGNWSEPSQIAHSVYIDSIIALGRNGHAAGVAARLDELERDQPAAAAMVRTLREFQRDFRLREMVDYLEALRDDEW